MGGFLTPYPAADRLQQNSRSPHTVSASGVRVVARVSPGGDLPHWESALCILPLVVCLHWLWGSNAHFIAVRAVQELFGWRLVREMIPREAPLVCVSEEQSVCLRVWTDGPLLGCQWGGCCFESVFVSFFSSLIFSWPSVLSILSVMCA